MRKKDIEKRRGKSSDIHILQFILYYKKILFVGHRKK